MFVVEGQRRRAVGSAAKRIDVRVLAEDDVRGHLSGRIAAINSQTRRTDQAPPLPGESSGPAVHRRPWPPRACQLLEGLRTAFIVSRLSCDYAHQPPRPYSGQCVLPQMPRSRGCPCLVRLFAERHHELIKFAIVGQRRS